MNRCPWAESDSLMMTYHDHEWGVPLFDDQKLFEFLILEGAQAGLSWSTILKRRENYRRLFDNFDAEKIVRYSDKKLAGILTNPDIIRNRLKIMSVVNNAKAYLNIKSQHPSFSHFIWQFVNGKPIVNHWHSKNKVPATTNISDKMSKELKKNQFNFVGSTICYAYMQAVGMVNDHLVECFRHEQISRK